MTHAAFASIFSTVDAISAYDGRGLPTGAVASIARDVAALRQLGLRPGELRPIEEISIDIHRLEMLLHRRDPAADFQVSALKRKLPKDCWAWAADLPLLRATPNGDDRAPADA